jgi:MoaA/NifB/PqqE/SkfB family radical SAM enzyme
MELIPVVNILREKKGRRKEAHLILFEWCNLRCSFCHQDHDSKVGFDAVDMIRKAQTLIDSVDSESEIVINITGGELFMDDVPDWMFGYYLTIGQMLLENFPHAKLVWGTNLIFKDVWRVARLIHMLRPYGKVVLATSYDPAGRFNEMQRVRFFEVLEEVAPLVETVNVVITKQNIESFLAGREGREVAWLCEQFDVYFDHYIPSQMYEYIQPDEELISALYLHLNKKYPNSYPIKDWKANVINETTCRSTKIINKDGVVSTCWSEAGKGAILDEAEGLRAKDEAEIAFVEHYDCFSCEYYTRCGLRCFLHDTVLGEKSKVCSIKTMFKAIL